MATRMGQRHPKDFAPLRALVAIINHLPAAGWLSQPTSRPASKIRVPLAGLPAGGVSPMFMTNSVTYSIVVTAGHDHLCLTLIESSWHPYHGQVPRQLESMWTDWSGWQVVARRLLTKAVVLAHDQRPQWQPTLKESPEASAPPGGSRGVLSVGSATLKKSAAAARGTARAKRGPSGLKAAG